MGMRDFNAADITEDFAIDKSIKKPSSKILEHIFIVFGII